MLFFLSGRQSLRCFNIHIYNLRDTGPRSFLPSQLLLITIFKAGVPSQASPRQMSTWHLLLSELKWIHLATFTTALEFTETTDVGPVLCICQVPARPVAQLNSEVTGSGGDGSCLCFRAEGNLGQLKRMTLSGGQPGPISQHPRAAEACVSFCYSVVHRWLLLMGGYS